MADSDETYFIGVRIGGIGGFPPDYKSFYWSYDPSFSQVRVYRVTAKLIRKRHNIVSVRVYGHEGKGGIFASAPTPRVTGPFSPGGPEGASVGHVVGGIGWYRKEFKLGKSDLHKKVSILFEGVYMNSNTWINGHFLGNHPYGYTSYGYDLTPYLRSEWQGDW